MKLQIKKIKDCASGEPVVAVRKYSQNESGQWAMVAIAKDQLGNEYPGLLWLDREDGLMPEFHVHYANEVLSTGRRLRVSGPLDGVAIYDERPEPSEGLPPIAAIVGDMAGFLCRERNLSLGQQEKNQLFVTLAGQVLNIAELRSKPKTVGHLSGWQYCIADKSVFEIQDRNIE